MDVWLGGSFPRDQWWQLFLLRQSLLSGISVLAILLNRLQSKLLQVWHRVQMVLCVLRAGRIRRPWHRESLAFVGTSPLRTMPLPRFSNGLSPVRTVVLASIWAALRNDVVDNYDLAVSDVPATFTSLVCLDVGALLLTMIRWPTLWNAVTLTMLLAMNGESFGLTTAMCPSTRWMTILTRPLRTDIFRGWHIVRIRLMRRRRMLCGATICRTRPGLLILVASPALVPMRLFLLILSPIPPDIVRLTGLVLPLGAMTTP